MPSLLSFFLLLPLLSHLTTPALAKEPFAAPNPAVSWTPASSPQRLCSPSTYAFAPPAAPAADWEQCAALYSAWTAHRGVFDISLAGTGRGFVPVLGVMDCTLGVRAAAAAVPDYDYDDDDDDRSEGSDTATTAAAAAGIFAVGDQDLQTLLDKALEKYANGTEMAVTGTMTCGGGTGALQWEIYAHAAA